MGTRGDDMVIEHRMVPDPLITDAEFIHQRASNPTKPNIGKISAAHNMLTLIGGLAYIRKRLHHHERAAAWFKSAYEALYGGGMAPSIDLGKVRVDTSIMAHDNGMVARVDEGKTLREVMDALGKPASDRVIACVVLGVTSEDYADTMPSGQRNQRQVSEATELLLAALDYVAELRGFAMRAA